MQLGEDEDWLWDVAVEMDQQDGLIWVYGPGDESVMAFTDFGIETLCTAPGAELRCGTPVISYVAGRQPDARPLDRGEPRDEDTEAIPRPRSRAITSALDLGHKN